MVKIPISKHRSLKRVRQKPIKGMVRDIKRPAELKDVKSRPGNKFDLKKFLLIFVLVVVIITVLTGLARWYRSYQQDRSEENAEVQIQEPEIDKAPEPEKVEEVEIKESVLVLDNALGWLNVRQGPGTNYPILTKIYPGEDYPLLEEAGEWFKIELGDDQEGWVFKQYVSKQ